MIKVTKQTNKESDIQAFLFKTSTGDLICSVNLVKDKWILNTEKLSVSDSEIINEVSNALIKAVQIVETDGRNLSGLDITNK
jgi:hypothetical protein